MRIYYAYGLRLRPPSIGCQPNGDIWRMAFPYRQSNMAFDREVWGIVVYDHELTAQEVKNYELTEACPCKMVNGKPVFLIDWTEDVR